MSDRTRPTPADSDPNMNEALRRVREQQAARNQAAKQR